MSVEEEGHLEAVRLFFTSLFPFSSSVSAFKISQKTFTVGTRLSSCQYQTYVPLVSFKHCNQILYMYRTTKKIHHTQG